MGVPVLQKNLDATGKTKLVASHALAGGVMAELQGGKFGHGFVSAGLTKWANPQIGKIGNDYAETVVAAVVGGSISEATGGKFANGAATAAFSYAISNAATASNDADDGTALQDRTFKSEKSVLRYIQRNVEQPVGLEDGGFILKAEEGFGVSRMIGGPQSLNLGPPPDAAVAAWHRHPDLGPGSEHFSFALSITPDGPGPYYHHRQGDVAYSFRHQKRFYLISPGDSLRVINPANISVVSNPRAQNFGDMFRLKWKVQE